MRAHPQQKASIMDPDRLAHVAVHAPPAGVVRHGIRLIHQAVRVSNDVDERKGELLAAHPRGSECDAAHICCWKLDRGPVGANGAQTAPDGVPAARDPSGYEALQSLVVSATCSPFRSPFGCKSSGYVSNTVPRSGQSGPRHSYACIPPPSNVKLGP